MRRPDTRRRCPACGVVVDPDALAVSASAYECPSCWTRQKPEGGSAQPIRLVDGSDPVAERSDDRSGSDDLGSAGTVGSDLRAARSSRGVTLAQASAATRIPERYLEALEGDAPVSAYPARAYARSFLREYARALALDDARLVGRFDEQIGGGSEGSPLAKVPQGVQTRPGRRRGLTVVVLALAALAAIAVSFQPWTSSSPVALPSFPTTGRLDPVAGEQPARGGNDRPAGDDEDRNGRGGGRTEALVATLKVSEPTWVEASVDGKQRFAETFDPGRSVTLRAKDELDLVLGNASGVRLRVDGEPVPLRADGEVVELELRRNGSRIVGLP